MFTSSASMKVFISAALVATLGLSACASQSSSSQSSSSQSASTESASAGASSTNAAEAPAADKPKAQNEESVVVLDGEWVQSNRSDDQNYMTATIEDNTMTITYHLGDDTTATFWTGTVASGSGNFSWESESIATEEQQAELLRSLDKTKHFTYEDGTISFPMTMMGVTRTIKLVRA